MCPLRAPSSLARRLAPTVSYLTRLIALGSPQLTCATCNLLLRTQRSPVASSSPHLLPPPPVLPPTSVLRAAHCSRALRPRRPRDRQPGQVQRRPLRTPMQRLGARHRQRQRISLCYRQHSLSELTADDDISGLPRPQLLRPGGQQAEAAAAAAAAADSARDPLSASRPSLHGGHACSARSRGLQASMVHSPPRSLSAEIDLAPPAPVPCRLSPQQCVREE